MNGEPLDEAWCIAAQKIVPDAGFIVHTGSRKSILTMGTTGMWMACEEYERACLKGLAAALWRRCETTDKWERWASKDRTISSDDSTAEGDNRMAIEQLPEHVYDHLKELADTGCDERTAQ